jgi:hypothetical protein
MNIMKSCEELEYLLKILFNQLNTFQRWCNLQEKIDWEKKKDS